MYDSYWSLTAGRQQYCVFFTAISPEGCLFCLNMAATQHMMTVYKYSTVSTVVCHERACCCLRWEFLKKGMGVY